MSSYFEDASHWRTARQSPLLQQDEHHAPAPETTAAPANHLNVARALLKPRLIFTLGLLTLLLLAAAMLLRQTAVRTQQRPVSWSEILPQTTLKFGDSFALVMGGVQPVDSHALIESPRELLERMVTDLLPIVEEVAQPDAPMRKEETDFHLYPYWRFLPPYVTNLPVNGTVKALGGSCFPHSSAHASWNGVDPAMTVSIELGHPTSRFPPCGDHYLLATLEGLHLRSLRPEPFRRAVHFHWPLHSSLSAAERSDLLANGIRVFRFSLPPAETLHSLKATLLLFRPLTARRPDALAERSNLDFLAKYRGVVLPPVEGPLDPLDVSKVRDGDLFNILRLDGLDPMLAWGMGATDGHEAVIFHDEHGEPYVYEATTKSSHWPTNGLQRTPLRLWLKQAQAAGYNVMYSTLSAASREALNSTAALEWFSGVEGVNYGYENILFTWIDTVKDNLPCLPPSFTECLQWQQMEIAASAAYRHLPLLAGRMYMQAWNRRLDTNLTTPADVFEEARQRGVAMMDINTIPEQDHWTYHTKRNGVEEAVVAPARVCSTFVCSMYKAGGLFGRLADSINCAEVHNFDLYSLTLYADGPRQVMGGHVMQLNEFNSRPPHPHMAERCPSRPPLYQRPLDC